MGALGRGSCVAALIVVDGLRGAGFGPVPVVPCDGAACEAGMRQNLREFRDAFSGRDGPFADLNYCRTAIGYIRNYRPDSHERTFVVDLMTGPFLVVTPADGGVVVSPGPAASNPLVILWRVFLLKSVGCHLSNWGVWPVLLFYLALGWTQVRQWRANRAMA